jgi:MoaA/NifB/PqqE/SkfB family radical SAM enzyme
MDRRRIEEYNATRSVFSRGTICHAPTVNINFDQSGIASACCYNRQHILGKYPENSLMEMWKGEQANQLRAFIKQGNFSHGCQLCEKQIDGGNYHGVRARHFDNYASRPSNIIKRLTGRSNELQMPQCMEFELSNICNLECTMCNGHFSSLIRKNREGLTELENPYDDAFVEQLIPFLPHLRDAKFLGGEPFLVPIYYKIWEKMVKHNPRIRVHITTNGTVYNNRVKGVLENLRCGIIVSIDSIVKETYEKIRVNASYDRVMANVVQFRKYARSTGNWFSFAVCPMTSNWQEMPDLIRYCNKNKTFVCFNTVYNPEELSLQSYSSKQLCEIVEYYEAQQFDGYGFLYRQNKKVFGGLINQLKEWERDNKNVE